MKIGFIGLGAMGSGIALNLRKAGYDLLVYDLRVESTEPLVQAGASRAGSVSDLARSADILFTSLPGPREMKALALGEDGLISHLKRGAIWFDLTTNSPTVVREVARACEDNGVALLDSPVSGRPSGARSGKLAIYVGGDRAVFEAHKAVLDSVGDQVLYVGAVGSGNTAKLVHNCVSLVVRMALAEGFTLGVKAGMDPLELLHAVRQGVIGRSRTFDLLGEQYLQGKYDPPSFALRLAHKDFTLALELARQLGVPMKQAEAAYQDYNQALERGWGDQDSRSPMQLQNERAGVEIGLDLEDIKKTLALA